MTREEAVKLLQATRLMLMDGANQPISDLYYALDMAIEALEQTEPQRDYERGRQDAWDIAQKVFFSTVTLYEAEDVAKQIAKTEPQTETMPELKNIGEAFETFCEQTQMDCEGCDSYEDGGELCDMCALKKGKEDAQTDMAEDIVRSYGFKTESYRQAKAKTEPQTSGTPYEIETSSVCKTEPYIDIETGILHWCGWEYRRIYKDEPQTEEPTMDEYYKDHDEFYDCDRYVTTNDEGERAYNCIGCEQTDCGWK